MAVKLKNFDIDEPLPWETEPAKHSLFLAKLRKRMKRKKPAKQTNPKYRLTRNEKNLEDQFELPEGPRKSKWWDLFTDGINNSGLSLWLTCRHQFYLRYVCGYEKQVYQDSLEFGNVFHWLAERWLKKEMPGTGAEAEEALREEYHPTWLENWNTDLLPKHKEAQESFYALAGAMFPHYCKKFKADRRESPLAVELEFASPYKLASGESITLYGTIDLALADEGGGVHILDHKTTSWINDGEIQSSLPLNFQLMLYAKAWKNLKKGTPTKISHDVIRRTTAKPKRGESLKKYAARIGAEGKGNPDYYFQRYTAPVTHQKLTAYNRYILRPIIEDFAVWARGTGPHYPNPNALIGRYGPCRLFHPITGGNFAGVPRRRPTTRGVEI